MSRSCQNLCLPPPSCCLPTKCQISCPIIYCTPPVSYPCMPRVPRIQCIMSCPSQSVSKPIKTMVYLPPCPTCPMSYPPKMEMTYLPPSTPPHFYVCSTKCVPCAPCPPPILCNSSSRPPPCLPCPPC